MSAVIMSDSHYAAKSITGEFQGKKNKALIMKIRSHYDQLLKLGNANGDRKLSLQLSIEHVRGHSGNVWNDRADELAGLGAAGRTNVIEDSEVQGEE